MKNKYESFETVVERVNALPVEMIVGNYVALKRRGRYHMGLCCFHTDRKLGSFLVTPDLGLWRCFACDIGGNGVRFVMEYFSIPWKEAVLKTALDFGIISLDEMEHFQRKRMDREYIKTMEVRYSKKEDFPEPPRAEASVIHNVYLLMREYFGLSEEHMEHLKKERHLSPERIKADYFTFSTNWNRKLKFIKYVKERYPSYTDDILKTVPGFFVDRKKGCLTFSSYKGIGILIRDEKNMVTAVQIRKDTIKDGEQRYVWLSSSFAFYRSDDFDGGCGSGSPKDVTYSKGMYSATSVAITEGRFKAETISSVFGMNVISVQGVSSWKGIESTLKNMQHRIPGLKKIYLLFDSDILGNHSLFLQTKKMCESIGSQCPDMEICYILWKKDSGKGIDDHLFKTGNTGFQTLPYKSCCDTVEKIVERVLSAFEVTRIRNLKQEQYEMFENHLQASCEKVFKL